MPLACRISTKTMQIKTITLKAIMMRIGTKKAPQNAPACDRKQLWEGATHEPHHYMHMLHDNIYKEFSSVLLTMTSLLASLPIARSGTRVRRTGTVGTTTQNNYLIMHVSSYTVSTYTSRPGRE